MASKALTWALILLTKPFDTVKQRMIMQVGGAVLYKGAIDCVKTIVAKEGVKVTLIGRHSSPTSTHGVAHLTPTVTILRTISQHGNGRPSSLALGP